VADFVSGGLVSGSWAVLDLPSAGLARRLHGRGVRRASLALSRRPLTTDARRSRGLLQRTRRARPTEESGALDPRACSPHLSVPHREHVFTPGPSSCPHIGQGVGRDPWS
jgi:hypothetical protein